MKLFFYIITLTVFVNIFAQSDTIRKATFEKKIVLNQKEPALFLNTTFCHQNIFSYLNPDDIQDIKIEKDTITINGKEYYGKIMVTLKKRRINKLLSLQEIKQQFTTSKCKKSLFMINGILLKDEVETYKISKDYVFKVVITNSKNSMNIKNLKLNFEIVNILTKTKENITTEILLRGNNK